MKGEVSEDEANTLFDHLWQKILKDMETTLDRADFDLQLFNAIHDFFPEKERKLRSEVCGRAEKMKETDLKKVAFDWEPSEKFLCPLQEEKALGTDEPRSEYKYLALPGKLAANPLEGNEFLGPLGEPLMDLVKEQPKQSPGDVARSVDWHRIQDEIVQSVMCSLPSDPQPRVRTMREIYEKVCEVADAVNAELAELGQKLSLEARGEMVALAIIYTWQSMSQAAWREHMKPIEEFKAEERKQRKYFCSQVLQSAEADREMAKKWIERFMQSLLAELSDDATKNVVIEIEKHKRLLCRKTIQQHLDHLLGSDDLDRQEKYIADPIGAHEQELQRRFESRVRPGIKTRQEELLAEFKDMLASLRSKLRTLCDHPELQAEKTIVEAKDFANDPCETEYARKQALARWIVAFFTLDGDLPSKWSVDETGQLVACDDKAEGGWQVKISQLVPRVGSPVGDEFLKKWIKAPTCTFDSTFAQVYRM